jgi:hypothetical protein
MPESIAFQQYLDTQTQYAIIPASASAYKTKAIVLIPAANRVQCSRIFDLATSLMNRLDSAEEQAERDLVPHLFLTFYREDHLGCAPIRPDSEADGAPKTIQLVPTPALNGGVLIRFECPDQVHLEHLLLNSAAQNIFNPGSGGTRINTVTRFIRTATPSDPINNKPSWKWAGRGIHIDYPFFYVEVQPDDVGDIDVYGARLVGSSSRSPEVIEVGRLWGTPSLYALVAWPDSRVANTTAARLIRELLSSRTDGKAANGATAEIWRGGTARSMAKEWKWQTEEKARGVAA